MNNYSEVLGEMLQLGRRYEVNEEQVNSDLVYAAIVKIFAEQEIISREKAKDINLTVEECKVIFLFYQTGRNVTYDYIKQFCDEQIVALKIGLEKGVDISFYDKPEFDSDQMFEILNGLLDGLDVASYAEPKFDSDQMRKIRLGMKFGLDTKIYADSSITAREMGKIILELLRKDI